ncbi:hypothetical protein C2845_PM16G19400 [Panicum miliaceum]|uniref:Cation transporter HKT7 n=1 Tax=Panicum miliaceum TaxID=4540 RepID=A0A3L6PV93_PANMI|nr:hypothetical protein C2845_PM16G19400 [Panicum miliaceum]
MSRCVAQFITHSFWRLVFQSNPFVVQLIYFMAISFAGFLALKSLNPHGKPVPRDFDLMFTSVSTATVSSMSTIQMEDLSDQQLWILILLMLLGGEVFTSMLGLHLNNAKANREELSQRSLSSIRREIEASISANNVDQIDMESGQSEAVISHNQIRIFSPMLPRRLEDHRSVKNSSALNASFNNRLLLICSAFGNVGYSLGYSCEKLMKPDAACKAASYGFVGWWTDEGKLIIILVMFIGRLKKFIIKEEKD